MSVRRWVAAESRVLYLVCTYAGLSACAGADTSSFATGTATATATVGDSGLTTSGTSGAEDDGDGTDGGGDGHAEDGGESGDDAPPEATCDDDEQNQGETDVDCGGPNCDGCDAGEACTEDADCAEESCVGNVCVSPDCADGVQNGTETDVDCGGNCGVCGDNLGCSGPEDCESGVCNGGTCTPPSCADGVLNGDETDQDCGGGNCMGCETGEMCEGNSDCLSNECGGGVCAELVCANDSDCDEFDGECTAGACMGNKCEAVPANDNQACDSGDLCLMGTTCSNGDCGGGNPVDCSDLSDQCNVGVCNQQNGMCEAEIANNGNPCDDGNACTVSEECDMGTCFDVNEPGYFFHENFANNNAGWTLGPDWAIGAASASNCALSCPGDDPGSDHTDTMDNGVAGVLIGGCTNNTVHDYYWLTSPQIDTPNDGNDVYLTYWRHLHADYTPYMQSQVEYSVDNTNWNLVWQTGNAPCTNDNAWTEQSFELPLAANSAQVWLRFGYRVGSTGVFTSGSWSLDDVTVGPAACTP